MAFTEAQDQFFNLVGPRRGKVLAVAVDATARAYDLTALAFGDDPYQAVKAQFCDITVQADGNDIFFYFDSATGSALSDTAVVSAGGTAAFADTYAAKIDSGTFQTFRIRRNLDKFIQVKCASGKTATLRLYASSHPSN